MLEVEDLIGRVILVPPLPYTLLRRRRGSAAEEGGSNKVRPPWWFPEDKLGSVEAADSHFSFDAPFHTGRAFPQPSPVRVKLNPNAEILGE